MRRKALRDPFTTDASEPKSKVYFDTGRGEDADVNREADSDKQRRNGRMEREII